ncbi:CsgE family curli-type amyloid fiber assembly protein [Colwellia sp. Bg11-28]|jgi:curli production assembly/transport component CsgE|uniref:CsgE family curli-type amyloid fiber assembly protein n=1 Tax=Colwellia sp. Bg11-28 TaxID=2058305 RepID=UPI000C34EF01|nr:CsgE family curli-type amyloid fiber assembly protein [Colwellia sp. Bg11-28]PKH86584.1 curli production assembly protein CsgE [Colwellia sp. Bg11-28]
MLLTSLCQATSEVEIGGLLLDNTKSRLGHDFYYEFSQLWRDIPNKEGINAQIIEQIVPRAGTRLSLRLNGQVIYVTHFGRRQSSVKEKVEQAIFILIDAMKRSQYRQDNLDMVGDGW